MAEEKLPWEEERCEYEDDAGRCTGIRLGGDGGCLAHTKRNQRDQALARLHAGADLVFTRGVPLTEELLTEILRRAPRTADGRSLLRNADFEMATFSGNTNFTSVTFDKHARFWRATFTTDVNFRGANFSGNTSFHGATFGGVADFSDVTFSGDASFGFFGPTTLKWDGAESFTGGVTFKGDADFSGASFGRNASFREANFRSDASFTGAVTFSGVADFSDVTFDRDARFWRGAFSSDASFREATFRGRASFSGGTFSGAADFSMAIFGTDVSFESVIFELQKAQRFGPLVAFGTLVLDDVLFSGPIDIETSAKTLSCRRSKFRAWANLRIRWANVNLEDADFVSPCLVARAPSQFEGLDESALVDKHEPAGRPRIISVRRVNGANLVLTDVDLHPCRFAGVHKLDGLRIESARQFVERPRGWHKQLGWPPMWKWTVRRALAEEHEWRYRHEHGIRRVGWYPEACQPPPPQDVDPLSASDIQNIYRDLRKGREDSKDEPGAAHFYYGEMEMRRAAAPPSFERFVLWLYWLVSGYGLRASRALFALVVTVLLCSVAINLWGLPEGDERDLAEIVVFSMQSTTSLLRAPDVTLTLPGQVIQIALRLLGPLFFGLALLSLRGRVKR